MCLYTHSFIILNEHSPSFLSTHTHTHPHIHKRHPDVLIREVPELPSLVLLTADAYLHTINTQGSLGSVVTMETGSIRDQFRPYWWNDVLKAALNNQGNYKWTFLFAKYRLQFEKVALLSSESLTTVENTPTSKVEVCQELISLGLIIIAVWFQLMLLIFHAV